VPGLEFVLRALAVLVAAWVAVALLRSASASLRASIWTLALAGVVVLPILTTLVPAWKVHILQPVPAAHGTDVLYESADGSSAASSSLPSSAPKSSSSSRAVASFSWTTIALAIWALGTAFLVIRIAASHLQLTRVARRATRGDDIGDLAVRSTDEVAVPAIAGLFRPVLLLPPDADSWTPELRRAVLHHELAHVRRHDAIGRLIGQLACAMYWFAPLVWIGASRADALREQACDDEVLRSGMPASCYAASLIELAQQAGCAALEPAALAMAASSSIQERVMTILNPSVARGAVTVRASLALIFAAASAVTLAAAILPVEREPITPLPIPQAASITPSSQTTTVAQTTPAPVTTVTTQTAVTATTRTPQTTVATQTTTAPQRTTVTQTSSAPRTTDATSVTQATAVRTTVSGSSLCGDESTTTRAASGSVSSSASTSTSSSTSTSASRSNGSDDKRTWNVKLTGPDCSAELRVEGNIVFGKDFDVTGLSNGGYLMLDVTEKGVRRQLDIKPDGDKVVYTWRVDGREQPYDAAARAWFATVMGDLGSHSFVIKRW